MTILIETATGGNAVLVPFTWFERNNREIGQRRASSWSDLCHWIVCNAPTVATKDELPLIKLATFQGDRRNNDTIDAIYGVEGDYDGEAMQPDAAAALLIKAGILALIYTTPRHRPGAPRWRVLCPMSQAGTPGDRHSLVARLNGVLGGVLAVESFTPSQAFYVGGLTDGERVQYWEVQGRCLDTIDGLPSTGPRERFTGPRKPLGSMPAPSLDAAVRALYSVDPNDLDRDGWMKLSAAFRQSATGLAMDDMVRLLWDGWCAQYQSGVGNDLSDNNKQWRSFNNGTDVGWIYLRDHASNDVRASLIFGCIDRTGILPIAPNAIAAPLDFWATFNADDAAKASAIVCTKHLAELGWPVAHNEFSDRTTITARVPWDSADTTYPREWNDNDTHGCKAALEATFIKPSKETVYDAVRFVALRNKYHPVRDYLNGLRWDGNMRLPLLASRYFGAQHTPYSELIGTKFMISAVARIKQPGCKADTMLILEGAQGVGKSSALRSLVGDDWFTDQMPDFSTKDAEIQLGGKWLVEIAELDRMNRAEVTAVKSYASRQIGTYRPPYGRATINVPRQCIFAGTTNETEYLRDQTGNRRFWPITCGMIDGAAIRHDRDQLWAEALFRYQQGEPWWLEGDQERLAQTEQDGRRERDPWEELIASRLAIFGTMPITIEHVCLTVLGIAFEKHNATVNRRVATCLKRAGYARRQIRSGENRSWRYVKD